MPEQDLREVVDTYYAPAGRSSPEEVEAERQAFLRNDLARILLEAVPDLALVLNTKRQIIAMNDLMLKTLGAERAEELIGLRPGEIVHCVNSRVGPDGCGTGPDCQVCGAVQAIMRCLETGERVTEECRIRTLGEADGGALDLEVHASFLHVGETEVVVLGLKDISSEKRRNVLEQTFFHDVLNVVTGLQSVVYLLEATHPEGERLAEYRRDLTAMARQIGDEITAHRELLAAERGELAPTPGPVGIHEAVTGVVDLYRNHLVGRERHLVVGECPTRAFESDATLVRRVLGNLVKNALEAIAEGETVTVSAEDEGEEIVFRIHNPGAMPPEVAKQVFQRSFSTKAAHGRGIGTHSVKLLTERYLGGAVAFTSDAESGTTFTVRLPRRWGED